MNKTIIQAKTPESVSVIGEHFQAECTPEYCLIEAGFGQPAMKIKAEYLRSVEIACELAQQMHDEKYGYRE